MSWLEVSVGASAEDADPVSEALSALGACAVTIRPDDGDEILEPAPGAQPLARANTVTGLFGSGADPRALRAGLVRLLGAARGAGARIATLEDTQWESAWRQRATARDCGHGLWVVPHDHPLPPGARAVVRLDPGLAFGTGSHPTTALCLEWLAGRDLAGRDVLDFGCGSGVLAIAAAALGAARVHAVDHDPQARAATAENARLNGFGDRIRVTDDPPPCDVLVANILANALDELQPRFARLVRGGGAIALSGILPAQCDALTARYAPQFRMQTPALHDGWALLPGRRMRD